MNTPGILLSAKMRKVAIMANIEGTIGTRYEDEFARHLRNLANAALPPAPPSFAEVVARVEAIDGVRFAAVEAGAHHLRTRPVSR